MTHDSKAAWIRRLLTGLALVTGFVAAPREVFGQG